MALPRGDMGLSAICDSGIPTQTHYFCFIKNGIHKLINVLSGKTTPFLYHQVNITKVC